MKVMNQFKLKLHRLSIIQLAALLLIVGLFLGVLFANVFHDSYYKQLADYQSTVFADIAKKDINYHGLFLYVLGDNFKEFAIFWLLSITILGIPYMAFKIIAFGFSAGFFVSAAAMQYGMKGFLLILVYPFPHGLIYLPLSLICLYKGFTLCRTIYYDKHSYMGAITRNLRQYLLLLLMLAIMLLLGSFLEAYPGAYFLKKTLNLFT